MNQSDDDIAEVMMLYDVIMEGDDDDET